MSLSYECKRRGIHINTMQYIISLSRILQFIGPHTSCRTPDRHCRRWHCCTSLRFRRHISPIRLSLHTLYSGRNSSIRNGWRLRSVRILCHWLPRAMVALHLVISFRRLLDYDIWCFCGWISLGAWWVFLVVCRFSWSYRPFCVTGICCSTTCCPQSVFQGDKSSPTSHEFTGHVKRSSLTWIDSMVSRIWGIDWAWVFSWIWLLGWTANVGINVHLRMGRRWSLPWGCRKLSAHWLSNSWYTPTFIRNSCPGPSPQALSAFHRSFSLTLLDLQAFWHTIFDWRRIVIFYHPRTGDRLFFAILILGRKTAIFPRLYSSCPSLVVRAMYFLSFCSLSLLPLLSIWMFLIKTTMSMLMVVR